MKTILVIILAVCMIAFLRDVLDGLYEKDKEEMNDLFKETEDKMFETKRKLEEIYLDFYFDDIEDENEEEEIEEDDDRTYEMIIRRLADLYEEQCNKGKSLRCPNCGANLQYKNGIAKCKYCDSEWS